MTHRSMSIGAGFALAAAETARRVSTATPEVARERLDRRALAGARMRFQHGQESAGAIGPHLPPAAPARPIGLQWRFAQSASGMALTCETSRCPKYQTYSELLTYREPDGEFLKVDPQS